jgi:hypothetical protein
MVKVIAIGYERQLVIDVHAHGRHALGAACAVAGGGKLHRRTRRAVVGGRGDPHTTLSGNRDWNRGEGGSAAIIPLFQDHGMASGFER